MDAESHWWEHYQNKKGPSPGIGALVGITLTGIITHHEPHDVIEFVTNDGCKFALMPDEPGTLSSVTIEDVCGDLEDLLGSPILTAEERSNEDHSPLNSYGDYEEHYTWTFYEFATIKGSVTIRWYGTSANPTYYSEKVAFHQFQTDAEYAEAERLEKEQAEREAYEYRRGVQRSRMGSLRFDRMTEAELDEEWFQRELIEARQRASSMRGRTRMAVGAVSWANVFDGGNNG